MPLAVGRWLLARELSLKGSRERQRAVSIFNKPLDPYEILCARPVSEVPSDSLHDINKIPRL